MFLNQFMINLAHKHKPNKSEMTFAVNINKI
jgi:hypothetical protein